MSYGAALDQINERLRDLSPIMGEIAETLRSSIDLNFMRGGRFGEGELGGGTSRWVPSIRALEEGGITLNKDGHLASSIRYDITGTSITISSNLVYAAIHQYGSAGLPGGVVSPVGKKALRFTIGGRVVFAMSSEIPARPFIVVQAEDVEEIRAIISDHWSAIFS
jgi:phage gpG-like protein